MPRKMPENDDDFIRMQQEAIRRVREMQERARRTLESNGMPIEPGPADVFPPSPFPAIPEPDPPAREEPAPREPDIPEPAVREPVPPVQQPSPPRQGLPFRGLTNLLPSFNLSLDSEQIMLLILMFILYQDSTDRSLLMALGYIFLT